MLLQLYYLLDNALKHQALNNRKRLISVPYYSLQVGIYVRRQNLYLVYWAVRIPKGFWV